MGKVESPVAEDEGDKAAESPSDKQTKVKAAQNAIFGKFFVAPTFSAIS